MFSVDICECVVWRHVICGALCYDDIWCHMWCGLVCGALWCTVYPKKYAHGFCFAVLCCGYTLTDFPISIRLTSLALWQSNDCPSASKATLMNMDIYFMWIHYERLRNHNKAKHNKTVCIFPGIYCNVSTCWLAVRVAVQWRGSAEHIMHPWQYSFEIVLHCINCDPLIVECVCMWYWIRLPDNGP